MTFAVLDMRRLGRRRTARLPLRAAHSAGLMSIDCFAPQALGSPQRGDAGSHPRRTSDPHFHRSGDSGIMQSSRRDFILRHTALRQPAAVPEIQLYLADEIIPLWRSLDATERSEGTPPPFWAFVWAGGQALARYLLDKPHEVAGKTILDFAAGSGICAIAAMKAGAAKVIAVDIDPFSVDVVALNAGANGVQVEVWERDLLSSDPPDVDLILAGDVCYEAPMAARVLPWLRTVHAHGIQVLLGDPGRAYFPRPEVVCLAEYDVPTSRDLEDAETKHTGVYRFRS
jgi:predicted nicotinamide N-methyase